MGKRGWFRLVVLAIFLSAGLAAAQRPWFGYGCRSGTSECDRYRPRRAVCLRSLGRRFHHLRRWTFAGARRIFLRRAFPCRSRFSSIPAPAWTKRCRSRSRRPKTSSRSFARVMSRRSSASTAASSYCSRLQTIADSSCLRLIAFAPAAPRRSTTRSTSRCGSSDDRGRQDESDIRRQVIIVLSDGEDTSSLVTFENLLDSAKRYADCHLHGWAGSGGRAESDPFYRRIRPASAGGGNGRPVVPAETFSGFGGCLPANRE